MRCNNLLRMPNPQYGISSDLKYIDCACGKCYSCLVNRRKAWLFRLMYEKIQHNFCFFATLTYDDNHCSGYVHRDHLQKFLKRLRSKFPFKYYAIGEYGTTTFRPHYHIILFIDHFLTPEDLPWYYGFTQIDPANAAAINYVLHYHVRPKEPVPGKRTFFACSKGLGVSFLQDIDGKINEEFVQMLCNTSSRIVSDYTGKTFVLPRYYTKKMEDAGYALKKPDVKQDYPPTYYEVLKETFSKIQLDEDGYPTEDDEKFLLSIIESQRFLSDKKLQSYNHQDKSIF